MAHSYRALVANPVIAAATTPICADGDCDKQMEHMDFNRVGDMESIRGMTSPDLCIDACKAYTGASPCMAMTFIGATDTCYLKNVPAGTEPVEQKSGREAVAWRMCESA